MRKRPIENRKISVRHKTKTRKGIGNDIPIVREGTNHGWCTVGGVDLMERKQENE